jgi:hypothetical protein
MIPMARTVFIPSKPSEDSFRMNPPETAEEGRIIGWMLSDS